LFARVLRRAEGGRWVMAIFLTSAAVTAANMFGQVELNDWNGRFFDAVGRKDLSGFVRDLWTFLVIIWAAGFRPPARIERRSVTCDLSRRGMIDFLPHLKTQDVRSGGDIVQYFASLVDLAKHKENRV
jgi:hypothetical protein